MKQTFPKILRSFIFIIFIIGFFPFFAEIITVKAVASRSLLSPWSLLAVAFLIVMTEVDIYTIANPPRITQTKSFQGFLDYCQQSYGLDLRYIALSLKSIFNSVVHLVDLDKIKRFKRTLISLGYLGMFISALIPGLGRLGNGMYARTRTQFPLGRVVIYIGCLCRFLWVYGGIHIIIF